MTMKAAILPRNISTWLAEIASIDAPHVPGEVLVIFDTTWRVPGRDILADFGQVPASLTVQVCQLSQTAGRGTIRQEVLYV